MSDQQAQELTPRCDWCGHFWNLHTERCCLAVGCSCERPAPVEAERVERPDEGLRAGLQRLVHLKQVSPEAIIQLLLEDARLPERPDEGAVYEIERDRHGLMFSGPLEVGECLRVRPVDAPRPPDEGPVCAVCGDEKILMEPDGSKAQPCYACAVRPADEGLREAVEQIANLRLCLRTGEEARTIARNALDAAAAHLPERPDEGPPSVAELAAWRASRPADEGITEATITHVRAELHRWAIPYLEGPQDPDEAKALAPRLRGLADALAARPTPSATGRVSTF